MRAPRLRRFFARALRRAAFVLPVCLVLLILPTVFDGPTVPVDSEVDVLAVSTAPPRPLDDIDLDLEFVGRVDRPTSMAVRRGDDALYVTSKDGRLYAMRSGRLDVALDVSHEVSGGFEQGLLGAAFTPDGAQLVVNFTNTDDESVTRIYRFEDGEAVASTGNDLLVVPKPAEVHNAGNLAFGPDDYLYLSLGDGGLSGDPDHNAQSLGTVLGKIHRFEIQPDQSYTVPASNPFADEEDAEPTIWAVGFRNPWRFSFDRATGDLWISDVGRDTYEEISVQPGGSEGGLNFGWNYYEGPKKYEDDRLEDRPKPKVHTPPVHAYKHTDEVCAVVGGYVYRGAMIDGLDGAYLYSDFCRGGIDAIRVEDGEVVEERHWDLDVTRISSFGQDAGGELYVLALAEGVVYRIRANVGSVDTPLDGADTGRP